MVEVGKLELPFKHTIAIPSSTRPFILRIANLRLPAFRPRQYPWQKTWSRTTTSRWSPVGAGGTKGKFSQHGPPRLGVGGATAGKALVFSRSFTARGHDLIVEGKQFFSMSMRTSWISGKSSGNWHGAADRSCFERAGTYTVDDGGCFLVGGDGVKSRIEETADGVDVKGAFGGFSVKTGADGLVGGLRTRSILDNTRATRRRRTR